jgi:hypothetical protein
MGLFGPSDETVNRLTRATNRLAKALESLKPPGMPGIPRLSTFLEENGMLKFNVTVPAEPASQSAEVVSRDVTIAVGDSPAATENFAGSGDLSLGPYSAEQNTLVIVDVVNIDDAGNRSEPRHAELTLVDNFPPAAPGEVGITVTGEE